MNLEQLARRLRRFTQIFSAGSDIPVGRASARHVGLKPDLQREQQAIRRLRRFTQINQTIADGFGLVVFNLFNLRNLRTTGF